MMWGMTTSRRFSTPAQRYAWMSGYAAATDAIARYGANPTNEAVLRNVDELCNRAERANPFHVGFVFAGWDAAYSEAQSLAPADIPSLSVPWSQ